MWFTGNLNFPLSPFFAVCSATSSRAFLKRPKPLHLIYLFAWLLPLFNFCSVVSEVKFVFFLIKYLFSVLKKGSDSIKTFTSLKFKLFSCFFFRRSRGVLLQCVILTLSAQKHPFLCLWYRIVHISRESSIYLECDNSVVSIFMFIFQRFYFLVEKKHSVGGFHGTGMLEYA